MMICAWSLQVFNCYNFRFDTRRSVNLMGRLSFREASRIPIDPMGGRNMPPNLIKKRYVALMFLIYTYIKTKIFPEFLVARISQEISFSWISPCFMIRFLFLFKYFLIAKINNIKTHIFPVFWSKDPWPIVPRDKNTLISNWFVVARGVLFHFCCCI